MPFCSGVVDWVAGSGGMELAILSAPSVVRLDRDTRLTADLLHCRSVLRLLQYEGDLLLTETRLLHPETPSFGTRQT